jgi:hypothetical protein
MWSYGVYVVVASVSTDRRAFVKQYEEAFFTA